MLDARSGKAYLPAFYFGVPVTTAEFSQDGRRLLVTIADGTWRVWNLASDLIKYIPIRGVCLCAAEFSPDGKQVITAGLDHSVQVWNMDHGGSIPQEILPVMHSMRARYSPNGRWVAVVSHEEVRIYSNDRKKLVRVLPNAVEAIFSPNSDRVATIAPSGQFIQLHALNESLPPIRLELEKVHDPTVLHAFPGPKAAFTRDGMWFIAGWGSSSLNEPGGAQVWNALTGERVSPRLAHPGAVASIAISPADRLLLTACADATAKTLHTKLWRIPNGEPVDTQFSRSDSPTQGSFSPDGKRVAVAFEDGTAQIWDSVTGVPITKPMRHNRSITSIRFSPDGNSLVTGSYDFTARLWDAATGDPISPPYMHDGALTDAVFSSSGKHLLTTGWDMTARIFAVPECGESLEELMFAATILSGRKVDKGTLIPVARNTLAEMFFQREAAIQRGVLSPRTNLSLESKSETALNWSLLHAMHAERMRDWPSLLFHLEQLNRIGDSSPDTKFRGARARAEIARAAKQRIPADFQNDAEALYPPRERGTPDELLDLSNFYNAPLVANWRQDLPDRVFLPLRQGIDDYSGVQFDVRGIVQLGQDLSNYRDGFTFPPRIGGIPINQKAKRIHFLHGSDWFEAGTQPKCEFRFADGARIELQLLYGQNVKHWSAPMLDEKLSENSVVAWRGEFPIGKRSVSFSCSL